MISWLRGFVTVSALIIGSLFALLLMLVQRRETDIRNDVYDRF